ncbi:putative acidic fibroblast growth factor intracellular-binding protein [Plasmopara halstedii]
MREVFEAFLTDPICVNEDVFALWLEGHNTSEALIARLQLPSPVSMPFLGGDAAAKLRELLWRDTVDQYRLYDKLEHYLSQPSLFRSQLLFQIPPLQQQYMVECYYTRDTDVDRWLLGKKFSMRLEKDLDGVAEHSGRTLKSCRRQLENLRRVYAAIEDRNFTGLPCRIISELFVLSESLACKYACLLFLLHTRFQVHPQHPITGFLTWIDLSLITTMIMTHWIPQRKLLTTLQYRKETVKDSVVSNGAQIVLRCPSTKEWPRIEFLQERLQPTSVRETIGLELSHPLTNCLRDLKAHLINDNDVFGMYQEKVISWLRCSATANGTLSRYSRSLNKLESNLHLVVHGFLTIGAGLSQPKELQHFLEYLFTRVLRVLHNCAMTKSLLNEMFTALIDALIELDVWYLNGQESRGLMLSSWDRFLSVCRAIVLQVYDRCQFSTNSQVLSDEDKDEMRIDEIANAFESQGN